jgi:hypothetical protein
MNLNKGCVYLSKVQKEKVLENRNQQNNRQEEEPRREKEGGSGIEVRCFQVVRFSQTSKKERCLLEKSEGQHKRQEGIMRRMYFECFMERAC